MWLVAIVSEVCPHHQSCSRALLHRPLGMRPRWCHSVTSAACSTALRASPVQALRLTPRRRGSRLDPGWKCLVVPLRPPHPNRSHSLTDPL